MLCVTVVKSSDLKFGESPYLCNITVISDSSECFVKCFLGLGKDHFSDLISYIKDLF